MVGSGCYSYAVHETTGPSVQKAPIDTHVVAKSTRWSFLWGLLASEWTPYACADPDGDEGGCDRPVALCDVGIGRVETRYSALSLLLNVVTLGTAVPAHHRAYCATDQPPGAGPGPL